MKQITTKQITTKQFQVLTDNQIVWDLLVRNYETNGIAAPFFEYALTSAWFDKRYLYLDRIWFDGDKAVGFVFYESPCTNIYFSLSQGYEALAEEMITYAEQYMPGKVGEKSLIFHSSQKALIGAAKKKRYQQSYSAENNMTDFESTELTYALPEGFHFVNPDKADAVKLAICTWKGFGHEANGPFENWEAEDYGTEWTPQKSYQGIISSAMAPPPHATYEYNVVIANEREEYVCYSGMWWVEENKLAYMEPLCTIPEYRHMGLAAAALSEHYRRMKALGAKCMTGGESVFYQRIGYNRKDIFIGLKKC